MLKYVSLVGEGGNGLRQIDMEKKCDTSFKPTKSLLNM